MSKSYHRVSTPILPSSLLYLNLVLEHSVVQLEIRKMTPFTECMWIHISTNGPKCRLHILDI
jgi:hypothetical protein